MLSAVGAGAFVSGSEDIWLGASSLVRGIDGLEIHHGLKFKLSMLGATPSPSGLPTTAPVSRASLQGCSRHQPSKLGGPVGLHGPLLTPSSFSGGS